MYSQTQTQAKQDALVVFVLCIYLTTCFLKPKTNLYLFLLTSLRFCRMALCLTMCFHHYFPGATSIASDKSDQTTSASWWRSHTADGGSSLGDTSSGNGNFFSATHGIVQTHPALSGDVPRPSPSVLSPSAASPPERAQSRGLGSSAAGSSNVATAVNPNPKSPFRHLDFATSATAELRRNPSLSAPDECARACREGEPPRICYYHFTLEYYTVLGAYVLNIFIRCYILHNI